MSMVNARHLGITKAWNNLSTSWINLYDMSSCLMNLSYTEGMWKALNIYLQHASYSWNVFNVLQFCGDCVFQNIYLYYVRSVC